MNNKIVGALIALIVVICGYLYASPYLAINNIKKAAQAGDSEKVSKYIDYPSVRQSLKNDMKAHYMKDVASKKTDEWEVLGAMIVKPMINQMIEEMVNHVVSPEGMSLLLQAKDPTQQSSYEQDTSDQEPENNQAIYKANYTSMKDFEIVIKNHEKADGVKVLMVRDGLSWKVNKIVVPLD